MTTDNTASTAERTLRLIELMLSRPDGWTPQELLLEFDLSRSALFALLRSLKDLGYIDQAGKRGRYIPGPRLVAWRITHTPDTQDMVAAFYQEMESSRGASHATDIPDETLVLVIPSHQPGGETGWLVAAQVEASAQVRCSFKIGQVSPKIAAVAQVMSMSPGEDLVAAGYSLTGDDNAVNLALPICRDGQTPEAALLLSAPAYRWSPAQLAERCLPGLREAAARLSYRLGASFYAPYQRRSEDGLRSTTTLTDAEMTSFLHGPYVASLACVRPDGRPHVIPVWQEWDGENFFIIAWKGAQWGDFVLQNPHVSLTIDEPWIPLRRVVVQGCAEAILAEANEIERLLQRLSQRYLGHPPTPGMKQHVQRAFRILPESVRGWQGLPVRQAISPTDQE